MYNTELTVVVYEVIWLEATDLGAMIAERDMN